MAIHGSESRATFQTARWLTPAGPARRPGCGSRWPSLYDFMKFVNSSLGAWVFFAAMSHCLSDAVVCASQ